MNPEIFKITYPTYVRSYLESSVQAWFPFLLGDIDRLTKVQRRATKLVRGLGNYAYEERLRMLKLAFKKETERRFDRRI